MLLVLVVVVLMLASANKYNMIPRPQGPDLYTGVPGKMGGAQSTSGTQVVAPSPPPMRPRPLSKDKWGYKGVSFRFIIIIIIIIIIINNQNLSNIDDQG